jgi:hypothetical protein
MVKNLHIVKLKSKNEEDTRNLEELLDLAK